MALFQKPVIKKFFANKIESSCPDWPDYLLEIANIFAEFDGEEFDRERLLDRFRILSDRSPYSLRDPSNFRDEFGAYGPYLGVFHIEEVDSQWVIILSGAARQYLCTSEPDVEAFCRAQLTLYQYPNGAGTVYTTTPKGRLSVRVQANVLNDTLREVRHGVKIVPLRLICRALLAKCEAYDLEPQQACLEYPEILALVNNPLTNTDPNPTNKNIINVLESIRAKNCPPWVLNPYLIGKFKRNFHIFEHTGLITRVETGLTLHVNTDDKLNMIHEISNMKNFFVGFDCCNTQPDLKKCVMSVIKTPGWGRYYDAANLSAKQLILLTDSAESGLAGPVVLPPWNEKTPLTAFPPLTRYESCKPVHKQAFPHAISNPEITRIKREKANRDHARLVERFAALARLAKGEPQVNVYIDMFVALSNYRYIFEMKSCNPINLLGQVRKGISQLYEYRFRSRYSDAVLCLVLQHQPNEPWIVEYLVKDRRIQVCWLVDEISIQCPADCREILKPFLL